MRKRSTSVLKSLIFSTLSLVLILVVGIYFFGGDRGEKQPVKKVPITSPPTKSKPSDSNGDKPSSLEALVRETFSLSKEGKIVNSPFISGKTKKIEVMNQWGKPDQTTKTSSVMYQEYGKHHVVLGYLGEILIDIRSYDSVLQTVRLSEIKKSGGEPDQVRYYQDRFNNQIILIYHVNSTTDLKWILPKPTEKEPNPKVDHISVYTQVHNQSDQQKSIDEIISEMSLDEKIGQMMIAGISGTKMDTQTKNLITNYKVGGMIFYQDNLVNPEQTVQLLNEIKTENVHNRLPLFLSVDQEGGRVIRLPGGLFNFPTNKEIGVINNSQFSYKVGTILGKELNGFGFNLDFAPVLDVNSNPKNPIIGDRSFGNNPDVVSKLGIQTIKGIQSQNIIATIKHFPGHGDTSVDSHLELPIVYKNLTELKQLELIPFERAIDNGADTVMVAHILLPKLDAHYPASMSKVIITDILRKQLAFGGVVITDDMTMKAITDHYKMGAAAVDSINAGSDIILVAHDYNKIIEAITSIKVAVQKGEISEQRINDSVRRIIMLKKKYGMNNTNMGNVNIEELNHSIKNLLEEYKIEPN
ncbi:beta-N-acetylhexosaminidase [Bacillus sp. AFS076308]|uniref:beta-N-acetylhexosaminidase n=1 Tax=unclassified Bacillus (in: firmicutes) TaxID=185979 RepID=UPI000BF3ABFB|nr:MULTISPECIES: beta-N-acetylhexosaminidase [unclassified Bacillus (in: firmicutes)]PFO01260.1 beta-N-acetylhexosaminidase [Bacillus sp. AFS076308]PGV50089.1 beta-N-acetylhexosaminidase [Bacillus sp. AFS037270]